MKSALAVKPERATGAVCPPPPVSRKLAAVESKDEPAKDDREVTRREPSPFTTEDRELLGLLGEIKSLGDGQADLTSQVHEHDDGLRLLSSRIERAHENARTLLRRQDQADLRIAKARLIADNAAQAQTVTDGHVDELRRLTFDQQGNLNRLQGELHEMEHNTAIVLHNHDGRLDHLENRQASNDWHKLFLAGCGVLAGGLAALYYGMQIVKMLIQ